MKKKIYSSSSHSEKNNVDKYGSEELNSNLRLNLKSLIRQPLSNKMEMGTKRNGWVYIC